MVASWEIYQQKSVLVATLHTDLTTIAWAYGLRNLQIPGSHPPMGLAGMPFDHSRNVACLEAINRGCSHIFFLDSDVIPPHDTILRLLKHNKPFISGLYCRRSPPHSVPVMIRKGKWVTDYRPGSVVEVELVGAGCLLISTELLKQIPPQRPQAGKSWFDWRVDCRGLLPEGECLSEDFTLCSWIRSKGLAKILVDTSIRCRHVGFAQSTEGQFLPMETIPLT